jgi:hypothetical protein
MRNDLIKKLLDDFPIITKDSKIDFYCGDGWFDLIYECFERIEQLAASEFNSDLNITFIKEKLGSIRIHTSTTNVEVEKALNEAANRSQITCENCGKPGQYIRTQSYWIIVRCDSCRNIERLM